jgi:hypothetical protein
MVMKAWDKTGRMVMTPKKKRVVFICFAIAVLGVSAVYGLFNYSSVCTQCGAMQRTFEWQIPLTSITLLRHSSEHATPASAALVRSGIIMKHEHQWLFCGGYGNGIMCAIGGGRHIAPAVQSEGVGTIISASQQYGELAFCDRILKALLDEKTSENVRMLGMRVPKNGFANRLEFHTWLVQESEWFDEMVALNQKK